MLISQLKSALHLAFGGVWGWGFGEGGVRGKKEAIFFNIHK